MTKKTLFLDFDGVLHPYTAPTARLFEHVVHFERVMRRFPEWQIVISSSWRDHESLDQLRSHFSPDIAERIVGVTPMFHKLDKVPFNVRHYEREVECRAWLDAKPLSRRTFHFAFLHLIFFAAGGLHFERGVRTWLQDV